MKRLIKCSGLIALTTLLMFSCKSDAEDIVPEEGENRLKEVKIKVSGLVDLVENEWTNGRITSGETASDEITYYIAELNNIDVGENAVAAFGVFDHLPSDLSVQVQDDTNYRLDIKAFRKGTSFGIFIDTTYTPPRLRHFDITNAFNYLVEDNVDVELTRALVYDKMDSSSVENQFYPELDIYYKEASFNSGATTELSIDLERAIFGIEIITNNLNEGSIVFKLSPYSYSTEIDLTAGQDSTFHIIGFRHSKDTSTSIETSISYVLNGVSIPMFSEDVTYNRLKVKRFEITLPGSADQLKPAAVNLLEEPLTRGDTVNIGG